MSTGDVPLPHEAVYHQLGAIMVAVAGCEAKRISNELANLQSELIVNMERK